MDNRYNYFADEEMNEAVRSVAKAKDVAHVALLTWREKMEDQLIKDILEDLSALGKEDIPDEILTWKSEMNLKFLVSNFASGILYAQEKLG